MSVRGTCKRLDAGPHGGTTCMHMDIRLYLMCAEREYSAQPCLCHHRLHLKDT